MKKLPTWGKIRPPLIRRKMGTFFRSEFVNHFWYKSFLGGIKGREKILNSKHWSRKTLWAKNGPFGEFLITWSYLQTELPDRPVSIGQKLKEKAKIGMFKCDIFASFQTMCNGVSGWFFFLLPNWICRTSILKLASKSRLGLLPA